MPITTFLTRAASHIRRNIVAPAALSVLAATTIIPTEAPAAELRTIEDAQTAIIEMTGRIERNDAARLKAELARLPADRPVVLRLNSQGGLIGEAIAIGRLVHQNGLRTEITGKSSRCISACGLIFLGGRDGKTGLAHRIKSADARLGFHGFRTPPPDRELTLADIQKAMADAQRTILAIADYLSDVGAELEFMSLMLENPDSGVKLLTNEKALALGINIRIDETGELHVPMSSARSRTASH